MYTIRSQKGLHISDVELERAVRHEASRLVLRHPEVMDLRVFVDQPSSRHGPVAYVVRLILHTRGAHRAVEGQALSHLRSAVRSAFEVAHTHLARHAHHRTREVPVRKRAA
mgnify:CR=1 FL=1